MFGVLDDSNELVGIYESQEEAEFVANDIGDCAIVILEETDE